MRKKSCIVSCNLTEKNRQYLVRLSIIDDRTGRLRSGRFGSASEVLNHALTLMLESEKHPYSDVASNEDLMASWRKFNIAVGNAEIDRIRQRQCFIANWKGD